MLDVIYPLFNLTNKYECDKNGAQTISKMCFYLVECVATSDPQMFMLLLLFWCLHITSHRHGTLCNAPKLKRWMSFVTLWQVNFVQKIPFQSPCMQECRWYRFRSSNNLFDAVKMNGVKNCHQKNAQTFEHRRIARIRISISFGDLFAVTFWSFHAETFSISHDLPFGTFNARSKSSTCPSAPSHRIFIWHDVYTHRKSSFRSQNENIQSHIVNEKESQRKYCQSQYLSGESTNNRAIFQWIWNCSWEWANGSYVPSEKRNAKIRCSVHL